ncbi:hypothetical protein TNCV_1565301 [Trichonephila clavipes]|nr:hypothetical protein TNCV_1565301 [Trichonephila clavipes]
MLGELRCSLGLGGEEVWPLGGGTNGVKAHFVGYGGEFRLVASLDIIGHWNAKRSSVPYLTYWALDVGWPAFEMVFPYWWTWKETVGGANW